METKENNRTLKANYKFQLKEFEDSKKLISSTNIETHECKWCREKYFKSEKYLHEHYLRRHKDLFRPNPVEKHIIYQTIPEEKKQITQKKYVKPPTILPQIKEVVRYKTDPQSMKKLEALEEDLSDFLKKATNLLTEREASMKQSRNKRQTSHRSARNRVKHKTPYEPISDKEESKEASKEIKENTPEYDSYSKESASYTKSKPIEASETKEVVNTTEKEDTSIVKEKGLRKIDRSFNPERSNVFSGRNLLSNSL